MTKIEICLEDIAIWLDNMKSILNKIFVVVSDDSQVGDN